jgi:hypothetical protein
MRKRDHPTTDLAPLVEHPQQELLQTAWQLCQQFPENHQDQCVIAAVDNLLNFDQLNTSRANAFCSVVSAAYQDGCATRMGSSIRSQVTSASAAEQVCNSLDAQFQRACLVGAGVVKE